MKSTEHRDRRIQGRLAVLGCVLAGTLLWIWGPAAVVPAVGLHPSGTSEGTIRADMRALTSSASREVIPAPAVAEPPTGEQEYRLLLLVRDLSTGALEGSSTWSVRRDPAPARGTDPTPEELQGPETILRARPGDRLEVLEVRCGNRQAEPANSLVTFGRDLEIRLEAMLPEAGLVHVVDERTGKDLSSLRVVPWSCSDGPGEFPRRLDPNSACGWVAASPLQLPASESPLTYWIGAEGYAWRRIDFGASSGRPLYALCPGSTLRVRRPELPSTNGDLLFRLERTDVHPSGSPAAECGFDQGLTMELSGMTPGRYRALLVLRDGSGVDLVLDARALTLAAGGTSDVVFTSQSARGGFGTVLLTARLADERDAGVLEARIEPVDGETAPLSSISLERMTRHSGSIYRWRLVCPPGNWRICVSPGDATTEVRVSGSALAEAFLDVPALPKLRLWTLDESGNSTVLPAWIAWRAANGESTIDDSSTRSWNLVRPNGPDDSMEFPVTYGSIEVQVRGTGGARAEETFEIALERSEQSVSLRSADPRTIQLRLTCDGFDVPAPEETWTRMEVNEISGRGRLIRLRGGGGARSGDSAGDVAQAGLVVSRAGTYRIRVGSVPGFLDAAPIEVLVDAPNVNAECRLIPLSAR